MCWAHSWRGLLLLVSTWFYFLVFAQFAFLHKVELLSSPLELKFILGMMTLCGAGGALLAGARCQAASLKYWICASQLMAILAAVLAAFAGSSAGLWLPSALAGLSLGVLTVAVVAWLSATSSKTEAALLAGLGTGLAYLLANVPFIFQASTETQSDYAAMACGLGVVALPGASLVRNSLASTTPKGGGNRVTLLLAVLVFGGLVWLDSGAFAWMQSEPSFHDAAWSDGSSLWSIGLVHCLVAVATGYFLSRGTSVMLCGLLALAALLIGYLMIVVADLGLPGVWVYMTGVSIYSTALVAFPLMLEDSIRAASAAGWLFAFSGWLASALGIGMVEDLGRMPAPAWLAGVVLICVAAWPLGKVRAG